jgi:uncharacterized membrane-anchored protein YhcB (DUF1043 family)
MSRESRFDIKNFMKGYSIWAVLGAIGEGASNVYYLFYLLRLLTGSKIIAATIAAPSGAMLGFAQIYYAEKKNKKSTAETSQKLAEMETLLVKAFADYQKALGSCERLTIQQIHNKLAHEFIALVTNHYSQIDSDLKKNKTSIFLSSTDIINITFPKIQTPFSTALTGGFLNTLSSDKSRDKEDENVNFAKFISQKWSSKKDNTDSASQCCTIYYKIRSRLKDLPCWLPVSHIPMLTFYLTYFLQNMVDVDLIIALPVGVFLAGIIAPALVYFTTQPSSKKLAALEQKLAAYDDKCNEYKQKLQGMKETERMLESLSPDFKEIINGLKKNLISLEAAIKFLNKFQQSETLKRSQAIKEQKVEVKETEEQKVTMTTTQTALEIEAPNPFSKNRIIIFPRPSTTTPLLINSENKNPSPRLTCGIL